MQVPGFDNKNSGTLEFAGSNPHSVHLLLSIAKSHEAQVAWHVIHLLSKILFTVVSGHSSRQVFSCKYIPMRQLVHVYALLTQVKQLELHMKHLSDIASAN